MPFDKAAVPSWVAEIIDLYEIYDTPNLDTLAAVYSEDVVFTDPIHSIKGLAALEHYFNNTAKNLHYCRFEFLDVLANDKTAWLKWRMQFAHAKLAGGKEIVVEGATELQRDNKVVQHIDYYDVGAMLYEHLPFLGFAARFIKRKLRE